MARVMRSCLQSMLKMANCVTGMAGLAMVLYAAWLVRVWQRQMGDLPFDGHSDHPAPWFIYTFLGFGATLCVVTCLGHIAAETANGCCLYIDMFVTFLLLILEAGVATDVFLNPNWEADFPEDPTGSFNQFKDFIRTNFELCKWIGLTVVAVQALSLILALILKSLGPHQNYDSDDEFDSDSVPLLKDSVHPTYVVGNPVPTLGSRKVHGV